MTKWVIRLILVRILLKESLGFSSITARHSPNSSSTLKMSSLAGAPKPALPIPKALCSETPGTWAYDTMSRRVDEEILQRTFEDNQENFEKADFKDIYSRFQNLRKELQTSAKLVMLDDLPGNASESRKREWNEWKQLLQPYLDKGDTWLSAPWMVTEFYLYRRLIQAIGYWDEGSRGYMYDPFEKQKRAGLESSPGSAEPMLAKIPSLPNTSEGIDLAASIALWGNKMDLSLWPCLLYTSPSPRD